MVPVMEAFDAGTATKDGVNGADWWLKYERMLPGYYVTRSEAKAAGWKPSKGNLHDVLPGKMLMGGEFRNKDGHLPEKTGRKWYEADFHYKSGYRNDCRIVFSDDGLIFATYDHYLTYYEII